ncbi:M48 family metallopeptidase [Bdellovibrio sp. NC01]|uniref:M48 family metallopeptidase n=1 Tax=Bdellovibrio sp. NC01 TaxID=2220073 RepID=UPI0011593F82|nr:M48 family metallopeptidase [Bdellovibrio sp. NC01]QDK38046.1 hypothetical protein DOE51_10830 [Bdellovibrio sp. NC01]
MTKLLSKKLLATLLFCCAIPLLGALAAIGMQSYNSSKFTSTLEDLFKNSQIESYKLTLTYLCPRLYDLNQDQFRQAVKESCDIDSELRDFETLCFATTGFTLFSLIIFSLLGWVTKTNRFIHLIMFRIGVFACIGLVCLSVITNAIVLVLGSYFIPAYFWSRYFPKLTGLLAIGAAWIVFKICRDLFRILSKPSITTIGKRLFPSDHPKLWEAVRALSHQAQTTAPDNIIIGLEPNFFVTEADVQTLDGKCKGRTLFISSSIMKLLSVEEFKSILAHEFGHFRGLDTKFSLHYNPVFNRLNRTQESLSSENKSYLKYGSLSAMPALFIVDYFATCFRASHAFHNRQREEAADELAIQLTSAKVFSSALLKATAADEIYAIVNERIKSLANEEKVLSNIPDAMLRGIVAIENKEILAMIDEKATPHPFDSHPATLTRVSRAGLDLNVISFKDIQPSASCYLENSQEIEEFLTHIRYLELGRQGLIDYDKIFGKQSA